MTLNLYIICDYLEQKALHTSVNDCLTDCPLKGITLYETGMLPVNGWLYLIPMAEWESSWNTLTEGQYVIWNWQEACHHSDQVSYIGISGDFSIAHVMLAIQQIFERFQKWELELYELMAQQRPLRELGAATLSFLENPISMYTAGLRNVFFCERKKPRQLMLFKENDVDAFLPYEEIEALRLNADFIRTIDSQEPDIFPDEFWGYRILYDNIRIEGVYIARVMVCEVERPVRKSDYAILRKLAVMLGQGIERYGLIINNHPKDFDNTILQLIDRYALNSQQIESVLKKMLWEVSDSYFCILIPVSTHDQVIHTVNTLCTRLESTIQGSAALVKGDYIIFIINLRLANYSRNDILSNLVYLLRENLLKAGISNEFSDFRMLSHYYSQAENALSIGYETDPTLWYYRYEHYAYRHLLKRAAEDIPIPALCPSGLLRLMEYDRQHNRDYTHSLKVYLEQNMSVTRAVRALYIQRSTFIYQLKRIKEISGLNIEDMRVRFHLMLIFQIIEERS